MDNQLSTSEQMHHFTMIMRIYEVIFSVNLSARRLGFHFFLGKKTKQKTQGFTQCFTLFENKFSKQCIPLLCSRRMQDSTPNGVSNKVLFFTKSSLRKTTLAKANLVHVSKELIRLYLSNFIKGPYFWIPLINQNPVSLPLATHVGD